MKWLRRIVLLGLLLVMITCGVLYYMFRSKPSWYRKVELTSRQKSDANNQVIQTFGELSAWVQSIQARRISPNGAATTDAPIGSKSVTFDEGMLNTLISDYPSREDSLAQMVSPYLENPRLVMIDDQIILAGDTKEFGTLSSAHFEPSIDEKGRLLFSLAGISAGRLPVPQSMLSSKIDHMKQALNRTITTFSTSADIDSNGFANGSAAAVAMSRLFLNSLDSQPSDPVLFLPYNMGEWRRSIPVKVDKVKVIEGSITLTLSPMSVQEQADLLKKIKSGYPPISAVN